MMMRVDRNQRRPISRRADPVNRPGLAGDRGDVGPLAGTEHTGKPRLVDRSRTDSGGGGRARGLMALATMFDQLIHDGVVANQAEIAKLGFVSRARVTQIMDLLNLAPEIQEALLYLPRVEKGRDPVTERELRRIVVQLDWDEQRQLWAG